MIETFKYTVPQIPKSRVEKGHFRKETSREHVFKIFIGLMILLISPIISGIVGFMIDIYILGSGEGYSGGMFGFVFSPVIAILLMISYSIVARRKREARG